MASDDVLANLSKGVSVPKWPHQRPMSTRTSQGSRISRVPNDCTCGVQAQMPLSEPLSAHSFARRTLEVPQPRA